MQSEKNSSLSQNKTIPSYIGLYDVASSDRSIEYEKSMYFLSTKL